MSNEKITINTTDISDYLHAKLAAQGYIPSEKELKDIANLVFDYLVSKNIITEDK